MIYTLTLNPAIDYVMNIDELRVGGIIRASSEDVYFGGKGINVSLVLKELGICSTALGFVAGFTGCAIESAVQSKLVKTDFIHLENGISRINVKLRSDVETDINGSGPLITEADIDKLFHKVDSLKSDDFLVMSGSVPKGVPDNIYEKIMEKLCVRGVKFVVDAEGDLLVNALKYNPFLIKPNVEELGRIFGKSIDNKDMAVESALKLKAKGAQNVIVSMGGDGAVLVDENSKVHFSKAHSGKVVNTVGAGDSMVAGFIAGYIQKNDYEYALCLGSAAGSATAFAEGLATSDKVFKLMQPRG